MRPTLVPDGITARHGGTNTGIIFTWNGAAAMAFRSTERRGLRAHGRCPFLAGSESPIHRSIALPPARLAGVSLCAILLLPVAGEGQGLAGRADTVVVTPNMVDGSILRLGSAIFHGYSLPCPYDSSTSSIPLGPVREDLTIVTHGDATYLMQVIKKPLIQGGYALDSTLYDRRTLRPIWNHATMRNVEWRKTFARDSIKWWIKATGRALALGEAAVPEGAHYTGGDRLLVRALKD